MRPWIQVFIKGDQVCLDAGEVHGVREGDLYQAFPGDSTKIVGDSSTDAEDSITLQVESVRGLTSDLIETHPETSGMLVRVQGTGNWKERQVGAVASQKIAVRFTEDAAHEYYAQRTRDFGEEPKWLHVQAENDTTASAFHTTVNSREEYEILDGSLQAFLSLPRIPLYAEDGAYARLVRILHYVAQFKYFEGIENRLLSPAFESGFAISAEMTDGEIVNSPGDLQVEYNGKWKLVAENKINMPLYLAVFNMTPAWGIFNLGAVGDVSTFIPLDPQSTGKFEIAMKVLYLLLERG